MTQPAPPAPSRGESARRAHLIAGILQVALAIASILEARRFPYWDEQTGPGAGFLPLWIGVVWLPIALALVWQSRQLPARGEDIVPGRREGLRLALFVLLMALLVAAFEVVGALIAVAAFAAVSLWLFEDYPWGRAALTGIVMSAVLYLMFATWLGIPLPKGPLVFL